MLLSRFTDNARHLVLKARTETIRTKFKNLNTNHLLLGLLSNEDCSAVNILKNLGVKDIKGLYNEVDKKTKAETDNVEITDIPFTTISKSSLEQASKESEFMQHSKVGTGHILLGLIKEERGEASKILRENHIDLVDVRRELTRSIIENKPIINIPTPNLDKYSQDLTKLANDKKLDPVFGRDREIERLIQILCRRTKNNPVLIGEPGVGKTAIVEGLAQMIADEKSPSILNRKRIISLDLGLLLAGTKYRGMFEERMTKLLKEVYDNPNIILFIDELHTIIGAGAAEGSLDVSNLIKPALARGELHCIGATTIKEYKRYIENNGALERRFQSIVVEPTDVNDTIEIVKHIKSKYEAYHGITFEEDAINQAVYLSDNYISDRYLPDKAIDVIDEAACYVKLKIPKDSVVKVDDIAHVITSWTGIPVNKMNESETLKIKGIENKLSKLVIGQENAIYSIGNVIKRSKIGIGDINKPIGSFIFLGPSGVGKSELSKCLAEYLFGRKDAIIQLDMSEYNQSFSVSKLIGSPPGYVGYEEGGQLTEKVRTKPHSVVLIDELEKAHPEVINVFLQILEDGHITDGKGRTVNFKNTIIIMTSNIGKNVHKEKSLGFKTIEDTIDYDKEIVMNELKMRLPVEFINRVNSVVVFNNLSKQDIYNIIDIKIEELNDKLESKNITVSIEPKAKEWLKNNGFSKEYGARFLNRCIDDCICNKISDGIISEHIHEEDHLTVTHSDNKLELLVLESSLV